MAGYEGHRGWINYLAVDPVVPAAEGSAPRVIAEAERLLREARLSQDQPSGARRQPRGASRFTQRIGFAQDAVVGLGKRLERDEVPGHAADPLRFVRLADRPRPAPALARLVPVPGGSLPRSALDFHELRLPFGGRPRPPLGIPATSPMAECIQLYNVVGTRGAPGRTGACGSRVWPRRRGGLVARALGPRRVAGVDLHPGDRALPGPLSPAKSVVRGRRRRAACRSRTAPSTRS